MSSRTGQGRQRVRGCALVLLSAVLALSGCSDDPQTGLGSPEPTAALEASTTPAPTAATPVAATPTADPSTADPLASPAPRPSDYRYAEFSTPSANIRCSMVSGPDGDGVRCDIGEKTWESPPKAPDCDFDWGNSLELTEEQATFACVSDALDPAVTLPYGQTETLGQVECSSRKAGVRCEHLGSRHGFELSKARYSLF